jgi:NitT/TauT family transport system substrate-binding protein
MANEINKLIWPSTSGIGHINEDQWEQTVRIALETENQDGAKLIQGDPPASAYSNEYVDQALAELEEEGVDLRGESYQPIEVELLEGGN